MSDTLRVNYEATQKIMEPIKTAASATISMAEFLMRNDKKAAQTEVTGGTWDRDRGVYVVTDQASGLVTEYKVSKNMRVTSGYSVNEKTYEVVTDEKGNQQKIQVEYDPKEGEWVKVNLFKKAVDKSPAAGIGKAVRPKLMGTLVETKTPDGQGAFSLRIEKAKLKLTLT